MQGACDAVEATIASLGTCEDATDESLTTLRSITEQMSRPEVADHLGQALNKLDEVRSAVDAALATTDDARQAAEQAGTPERLMQMLQGVMDAIGGVCR
jgi:hypothetical protein